MKLAQGCVLPPLLCMSYSNSWTNTFPNRHFIKYADDSALASLMYDGQEEHGLALDYLLNRCEESNLVRNNAKNKGNVR